MAIHNKAKVEHKNSMPAFCIHPMIKLLAILKNSKKEMQVCISGNNYSGNNYSINENVLLYFYCSQTLRQKKGTSSPLKPAHHGTLV